VTSRLVRLVLSGVLVAVHLAGCGDSIVTAIGRPELPGGGTTDSGADAARAVDGGCRESCAGGTTCCAGSCVHLESSQDHCGACGHTCESAYYCAEGFCTCGPGRTACGDQCVKTSSDPVHCGSCDTACGVGEVCNAGHCASGCSGGLSACYGACVDLFSDIEH
jgi:hypothetical protein